MAADLRKWLCAIALACALGTAHAASPPSLEDAFWACDYLATTRGTSAAPADTCVAVYEEIKAVKFAGDFDELVAWWQVNKEAAHLRIAAMVATAAEPAGPAPIASVPEKLTPRARLLAATRAYFAEIAAALRGD